MIKEDKILDTLKVLHFPDNITNKEIEKLLENRKDIIYYTRIVNNELHLVKYNKDGFFNSQQLIESLFKHYEKNNLSSLLKGIKIKGNNSFSIINNVSEKLLEIIKKDLSKILVK